MSAPSVDPADLLDLKFMPAWVKEPSARDDYADYEGEEPATRPDRAPQRPRGRDKARRKDDRPPRKPVRRDEKRDRRPHDRQKPPQGFRRQNRPPPKPEAPLDVAVEFLPRTAVLDNVIGQIKAEALAYSLFFLARSFLEKPQRYEVSLKAKPESPLFRLGDNGAVSTNREFIESNAFRLANERFYRVEVTQSEAPKGNFISVARCRLSGTILGPPNHHDYQRKLRGLYEQRFSRRMTLPDYQRQIENVSDPAAIEQWKEQARSVTTYVTLNEDPAVTFPNAAEAERHFRQTYLPTLVSSVEEMVIDGVSSRVLADHRLRRHIEQAWSAENSSPSRIMQELAKRFRDVGLQIFRHRRGMLFVSSIRVRPFVAGDQSVSGQVKAILDIVGATPRIRRKEVGEKLLSDAGEDLEARRLSLASDLRWLISEGYLIEFNDGALDLPRAKVKKPDEKTDEAAVGEGPASTVAEPAAPSENPDTPNAPPSSSADTSIASVDPDDGTATEQTTPADPDELTSS